MEPIRISTSCCRRHTGIYLGEYLLWMMDMCSRHTFAFCLCWVGAEIWVSYLNVERWKFTHLLSSHHTCIVLSLPRISSLIFPYSLPHLSPRPLPYIIFPILPPPISSFILSPSHFSFPIPFPQYFLVVFRIKKNPSHILITVNYNKIYKKTACVAENTHK